MIVAIKELKYEICILNFDFIIYLSHFNFCKSYLNIWISCILLTCTRYVGKVLLFAKLYIPTRTVKLQLDILNINYSNTLHIEVFKLQFIIHISQILHVLYMHAIFFPWSELVEDKFINKLHMWFLSCYCGILKEKDLVHMLFKEYVPRFSHPKYQNQPYLQLYKIEMQPGRQYMTQMGCLELKGILLLCMHRIS